MKLIVDEHWSNACASGSGLTIVLVFSHFRCGGSFQRGPAARPAQGGLRMLRSAWFLHGPSLALTDAGLQGGHRPHVEAPRDHALGTRFAD
jgi:hypothetical protein